MFDKMCTDKLLHFNAETLDKIAKRFETTPATEMDMHDLLALFTRNIAESTVLQYTSDMLNDNVSPEQMEANFSDLALDWMETRDELNEVLDEMAGGEDASGLELLVLLGLVLERLDMVMVPRTKQSPFALVVDNSKKAPQSEQ